MNPSLFAPFSWNNVKPDFKKLTPFLKKLYEFHSFCSLKCCSYSLRPVVWRSLTSLHLSWSSWEMHHKKIQALWYKSIKTASWRQHQAELFKTLCAHDTLWLSSILTTGSSNDQPGSVRKHCSAQCSESGSFFLTAASARVQPGTSTAAYQILWGHHVDAKQAAEEKRQKALTLKPRNRFILMQTSNL